MTTTFEDGSQVEVAIAGSESVLGVFSLTGMVESLNRVYMQVPGYGYRTRRALGQAEFRRGERFHDLSLAYLQAQFLQSAQTAGCNARHSLDQRLARWLLMVDDRVTEDVIPLSQELISQMLGVRRSSVSIQAGDLQERKLIKYSRGKVRVLDRKGLEVIACECYGVVRDHLNGYAERGTPREA